MTAPLFAVHFLPPGMVALVITGAALACFAIYKLHEKNMQELDANQKEIDMLKNRINELTLPDNSDSENKVDSND